MGFAVPVAFSPDGRSVLTGYGTYENPDMTGDATGLGILWDVETGNELRVLDGHRGLVDAVAFSPDGRRALTGAWDSSVRMWDVETGEEQWRVEHEAEGYVTAVAFAPDGRRVASGDIRGAIRLWDADTGTELLRIPGHQTVKSLAFSPQGDWLVSAGHMKAGWPRDRATLWNAVTGESLREFVHLNPGQERETHHPVWEASFSPDGAQVLTGGPDGVRLWDIDDLSVDWDGREDRRFNLGSVSAAAFSPNGARIVVGHPNGIISLWDLGESERLQSLEPYSSAVTALAFSPEGESVLIGGWDSTVVVWNAVSGSKLRYLEGGDMGELSSVAFSPDGVQVLTGSDDGAARLWDADTGEQLRHLQGSDVPVQALAFSPSGREIYMGQNGALLHWDATAGTVTRRLANPKILAKEPLAFSADGQIVLTSSSFRADTATLWDLETGRQIAELRGHSWKITAGIFSPDGRHVLSGSLDKTARIWDVQSGSELQRLIGHTGYIYAVAFSPDGRQVLTGSWDRTARLWDVETGAEIHRFVGHATGILSVAFSSDGRWILTGGVDGVTRIWRSDTGAELAQLVSLRDGAWAVVDPEGRYDAAHGGEIEGLHWVAGLEPIELSQLKERYYEPGLLAKVLGYNQEGVRPVDGLAGVDLAPSIDAEMQGTAVRIRLTNRGGGIGRVGVWLNGKEITADARAPGTDPNTETLELALDLADHPYLKRGEDNSVEVKALNGADHLSSRGSKVLYPARGEKNPPELWALVVGVSDYRGRDLDLRYAEKDAVDMARALELAAGNLFGADRVHVTLLSTAEEAGGALAPTKANLLAALESIAERARATDILVVYLAGHGITQAGPDGEFYYLTRDASSGNLDDPWVRDTRAVSSGELTDWIAKVNATKQVLILDTCGAGRVVEVMTESRDVPSSQKRALERMKDRMGLYVLAGSAADAVSYEASRFQQGLLTYSLLLGMRGAALREDEFVDVGRWFNHAVDRVPELARDIGGIQRPQLATPRGSQSFDVGRLDPEDRASIPLAQPMPFMVRAVFQDQDRMTDHLRLTQRVNEALRAASARGKDAPLVFLDASELPGAYALGGLYQVSGDAVRLTVVLSEGTDERDRFTFDGSTAALDALVHSIISEVESRIAIEPGGTR